MSLFHARHSSGLLPVTGMPKMAHSTPDMLRAGHSFYSPNFKKHQTGNNLALRIFIMPRILGRICIIVFKEHCLWSAVFSPKIEVFFIALALDLDRSCFSSVTLQQFGPTALL